MLYKTKPFYTIWRKTAVNKMNFLTTQDFICSFLDITNVL